MTREDRENTLHCLKVMVEEANCEDCKLYGTTGTDHCERDCVRNAIRALEQEPKWIQVSERLPKIGSTVLIQFVDSSNGISMDDYGSCELSWLRNGGGIWITHSGTFKESEIFAWMPLPQPYKIESEDGA